MRQGLIHLYTGDGKGKTTAALGLLLRAYGSGMRVVLAQFFKGRDTGELHAIEKLPGVTVLRYTQEFAFYPFASEEQKAEMHRQNNLILIEAFRFATEDLCDLLILDEICAAYQYGAVDAEMTDKLIMHKPSGLELVLTGRNAPPHFMEAADYVTEFMKRKHPYDNGTLAREGVEY
ncbi:MAG: cob(I)yrinic acid a,c-diamide adenosyltransferase [Clostridiales bacterium]|nr:cob(I)yrinic acid a,c-diamide adenosyltransferase [Clostridiales bacterium]